METNVFLKKFIDSNGKVDYKELQENSLLIEKISEIESKNLADCSSRDEELVFWLNAYNLLVLKGVLEKLKKNPNWNGTKTYLTRVSFFVLKKFTVANTKISLYNLENKILRKKFKDPRIHFVLNCASSSCPVIPSSLFEIDTLEQTLDNYTKIFINDSSNVNIIASTNQLKLNPIFKWYKKDFDNQGGILNFIKKYHENFPTAMNNPRISFLRYNWSLNSQ